jgi:hypothetical protein
MLDLSVVLLDLSWIYLCYVGCCMQLILYFLWICALDFLPWLGKNEDIKKWLALKNRRRSCSRFATNLGNQEWIRSNEREEKGALKTANLGKRDRNHSCPYSRHTRFHTLRPHTLRPQLRSYDQTRSRPIPRGPFLPAPHDAAPHDVAPLVSTEWSTERDFSCPSSLWEFQTRAWEKLRKN